MSEKSFEQVLEENGFFVWRSVGVSMFPLIREGRDQILIRKRPEARLKKYDVVLYRRPDVTGRGAYVLHRILRVNEDGTYWIVGDNCYIGETVKEEDVLGVLISVIRKGKNISVADTGYRIYTRLWCDCYPLRFFILHYGSLPIRAVKKLLRMAGAGSH